MDEGCEFFANYKRIYRKLKTLSEVGLGYIKIGQASTTLSGGEAQRVKLSTELSRSRPAARSMCWTSRRPACTPPTWTKSCARC